jgi:membrane protease YdiL (CAAX protease family)
MINTVLFSNLGSTAAYALLMMSIVSLWINSRLIVWMSLLASATLTAMVVDRITISGLFAIVSFGIVCFSFYQLKLNSYAKFVSGVFLILFCLFFGNHKIPGFNNWLILPEFVLSSDAFPISLYLNFDKAIIGLFIIGFGMSTVGSLRECSSLFKMTLPIIFYTASVLLGLSLATGYVRVDLKWFEFSWIWLLVNLLFTCVAEEAFFRGFLQHKLTLLMQFLKFGSFISWIFSSILFGLAHLAGGWGYVCLSTVAGLFYGHAFRKTSKIEASILVHFSVNAIHFLFFTYPALKVTH